MASISIDDRISHRGDTDCYIQFHATDQWRVVTSGVERLEVNGTATTGLRVDATSDMRAPIFYDRANTGRYLDPAGSTSLSIAGNIIMDGNIPTIQGVSPPNGAIRMTPNLHLNSGDGSAVIINWDNGTTGSEWTFRVGNGAGSDVYYIRADGYSLQTNFAENSSSFRAPIFYDLNNTAFYLDPAVECVVNAVTSSGLITGRSSAATNVNTANDTGSISVRGSTTTVASMSFHRTGAYAINMGLGTDNVFRIGGWSASANAFQMDGSGNLTMLNNITAYSDIRLKKDIVKIEDALEKVSMLNGYTYTRTDTDTRQMGVIAQEVMKIIPEVVLGSEETNYSVAYGNMVGLLIEAIKELKAEIDELKNKS
jgi:hypothetical protein